METIIFTIQCWMLGSEDTHTQISFTYWQFRFKISTLQNIHPRVLQELLETWNVKTNYLETLWFPKAVMRPMNNWKKSSVFLELVLNVFRFQVTIKIKSPGIKHCPLAPWQRITMKTRSTKDTPRHHCGVFSNVLCSTLKYKIITMGAVILNLRR